MSNYKVRRTIVGQLPFASDLYDVLTQIVQHENIRLGRIQAIGATSHAVVAYYDQDKKKYLPLEFDGGMEIVSYTGNVSMRDDKPFVHAHIVLSDREGRAIGGHLLQGTTVFACEIIIEEFEGESLVRQQDEQTGLYLWQSGRLV